jgi:hypothetical protein
MKTVQLVGMTPEENNKPIFEYFDKKFDDLEKSFQPKEPTTFLTRKEVAKLLSVDISSIHNMTVKGILQKYQISGRVLYKRSEVENAIIKLK